MIQEFVNTFMKKQDELKGVLSKKHPENYGELVKIVITLIKNNNDAMLNPDNIHCIISGTYSGTKLYIIESTEYDSDFWYVKIGYGSCSGCDTLDAIYNYSSDPPNEDQIKDYMTLALHIVQGIKKLGYDCV